MNKAVGAVLMAVMVIALVACTGGPPGGLRVVDNFDLERYEGRWYEIARLDHRFERGLSRVTADYEQQTDGSVRVVNRGFDERSGEWEEAVGKARFVDAPDQGRLKVSFFGPFYGAYNIVALDQNRYEWVMVTGPTLGYLWILARSPELDPAIYTRLVNVAREAGFATDKLIIVQHSPSDGAND